MNKQIYFRIVSPAIEPETWTEGQQKYLLFNFLRPENYIALLPSHNCPLLIIPNHDSAIVKQIKNRQKGDFFTTSFHNLKLKRDFLDLTNGQGQERWLISGFLVKNY